MAKLDPIRERLLQLVDERGTSLAAASRVIGRNHSYLQQFIHRGTPRRLAEDDRHKLANFFDIPEHELVIRKGPATPQRIAATPEGRQVREIQLGQVTVRAAVQAGEFEADMEWPHDRQYVVTVPIDKRYAHLTRFALEVRGLSMNQRYAEGAILICVPLAELERWPKNKERVIVQRRNRHGEIESTVKEIVETDGRIVLWPRSDHEDYQQPIPLQVSWVDIPETPAEYGVSENGFDGEEVQIIALVIGSYTPETTDY